MKKEISTKIINLDVDVILKYYNRPEFWSKEWLVYDSDFIKIYTTINTISCCDNMISMKVFVKQNEFYDKKHRKKTELYYTDRFFSIPINHPDYSKEKFKRDLLLSCINLIEYVEIGLISEYAEYKNAVKMRQKYKEKFKDIASNYLDTLNIYMYDVRKAYIDDYVNRNNYRIPNFTGKIIENYSHSILQYHYLMLCAYFDDKEMYDKIKEKCKDKRKSIGIDIWLKGRELVSDKFTETMKEELVSLE